MNLKSDKKHAYISRALRHHRPPEQAGSLSAERGPNVADPSFWPLPKYVVLAEK